MTNSKMRKKHLLFPLIIGTFSFLVIISCSERKEKGVESSIILKYANAAHKDYNKFREVEAKKFEELYPNVTVKFEVIPATGYWGKILTEIAGGIAPDVFRNDDVMALAKKGVLLDLTHYMEREKEYFEEIYPGLIEFHRYKGRIYGLPSNLNVDVLFYNRDLFDEASLPYPDETWNWDDMLEAAKRLTKTDNRGFTTQFGISNLHNRMPELFRQNGGAIWNEDRTECIINSPQNVEVLRFYKDLIYRYRVIPTPGQMQQQNEVSMFTMGRLGMIYGGRWLTTIFKLRKDLNWGIAPLPKRKNRDSKLSFITLSVSSATEHPELAYQLIRFLTRPEAMKFLVERGDSIPIRWTEEANQYFLNDPTRPENENNVYLETMEHVFTDKWTYHPDISYYLQKSAIDEELGSFTVLEEMTAEETLKNIEERLNRLLRENKQ